MPPPLNLFSLPHMLFRWLSPKLQVCWARLNGRETPPHLRPQSPYDFAHATSSSYKLPKDFMLEFGEEPAKALAEQIVEFTADNSDAIVR